MSFPYWPGNNGAYQQLNYVSSTQALSIVPGGNTVFLNVGGGGSGGESITASTINVSTMTAGILDMDGPIAMNNNAVVWSSTGSAGTYWDAGQGLLFTIVPNNSSTQIGTSGNPYNLSVGVSSVTTTTKFAGPEVSSLALYVSSVNGAPYPPQGAGAVSTIGFSLANFPGGSGNVPVNNTPIAVTDSFAVDPTHRYRITFEAAFANADGTGPTYTTSYVSGTAPTLYLNTFDNRTAVAGLNDWRQSISGVFVPSSSPCQLIMANTSAISGTATTINVGTGVVVEDLGAI